MKISRIKAALDVYDPKTMNDRQNVAGRCEETMKYGIHTYVEDLEDSVNQAYAAWPTRLYLIDLEGKVVYQGELGPFGFRPSKFNKAIEQYLESEVVCSDRV
jgi:hypothetical protein